MNISHTGFDNLLVFEPKIIEDSRGYFFESFRENFFKQNLPNINFCQENESKSKFGVLRGLHYQLAPFSQSKLVRVISGSVLDVVVDMRKELSTFGKYFSIILISKNKKQLFIPKGFAHGFLVLSDQAIFSYKVDNYYNEDMERGIAYDDKILNIDWQLKKELIKLSEKDSNLPSFKDSEYYINSKKLYD